MYNRAKAGDHMKIAVVLDSGSDYYNQNLEMEGLFAIPLQIIVEDEPFRESVEISKDQVNALMQREKDLKTSLPNLGDLEVLFKDIKDQAYDMIFALPITEGISGTLNAMRLAADAVDIDFTAYDCYTTAHIQLESAIASRKLFDQGASVELVIERLNEVIQDTCTYIIPDNLDHLAKGGRLSPMAAKLGGLLKIKPILFLGPETKGIIDPFDKVRTMSKAIATVVNDMIQKGVNEDYIITVVDVNSPQELDKTAILLKETFPNTELRVTQLISTVSVHVGIGTIAFQYQRKVNSIL